jgi:hypothetical protein
MEVEEMGEWIIEVSSTLGCSASDVKGGVLNGFENDVSMSGTLCDGVEQHVEAVEGDSKGKSSKLDEELSKGVGEAAVDRMASKWFENEAPSSEKSSDGAKEDFEGAVDVLNPNSSKLKFEMSQVM